MRFDFNAFARVGGILQHLPTGACLELKPRPRPHPGAAGSLQGSSGVAPRRRISCLN